MAVLVLLDHDLFPVWPFRLSCFPSSVSLPYSAVSAAACFCAVRTSSIVSTQLIQKLHGSFIGFRMNTGSVQRIVSIMDPHKACTLLICLRSQLRHLQKLMYGSQIYRSVSLIFHNILRNRSWKYRKYIQEADADAVFKSTPTRIYAVLYHTAQRFSQLLLVHIMLILSHTDGFRINLYKLCQRILQPVLQWKLRFSVPHQNSEILLLPAYLQNIRMLPLHLRSHTVPVYPDSFNQLHDHLLGFSGCCTVSDRDQGNMIFVDQLL